MSKRESISDKRIFLVLQVLIFLLLLTSLAIAQTEPSSSHNYRGYGGSLGVWIIIICYASRKRPIGGWLLYYYIGLCIGTLVLVTLSVGSISDYLPQDWDDRRLYMLFLFSTIPSHIALMAEIIVATLLLIKRYRNVSTVNALRFVFLFSIVSSLLTFAIDRVHFRDFIIMDVASLVWPVIWLLYFSRSQRVEYALKEGKWDSWSEHRYPFRFTPSHSKQVNEWPKPPNDNNTAPSPSKPPNRIPQIEGDAMERPKSKLRRFFKITGLAIAVILVLFLALVVYGDYMNNRPFPLESLEFSDANLLGYWRRCEASNDKNQLLLDWSLGRFHNCKRLNYES